MRIFFITALAFALIAATCLAMTSCNAIPFLEDMLGNSNKVEDSNDNNQGLVGEYVAFDFSGSIANIGDATSIGVTSKVMETDGDAFKIYHNMILSMTTVDGADKLFDVTFTKIETEGATEEITGTRRAMPKNGEILIAATEGFTYAIYGNGVKMCEGIVDNGAEDLDPKAGVIAVGGFTDGEVYDVAYAGIGKETVISE